MKGIYCFIDKQTGMVDYIGRFSSIRRIREHYWKSRYDDQQFNRVLQNNPNRYESKIICEYPDLTNDELNYLEIKEILKHKFLYGEKPRFNFTIGGEGTSGYVTPEETREKISKSLTGRKHTTEARKNISEGHKGIKPWNTGLSYSTEQCVDLSKRTNTTGYFRVYIKKDKTCKQGYNYVYQYYDKKNKRKSISSVNIKTLEEKVKSKGLEWKKL